MEPEHRKLLRVGVCIIYTARSSCTFTLAHGRHSLFSYLQRSIHFSRRVISSFVTPYRAVQLTMGLLLKILPIAFLVMTQLTTTTSVLPRYSLRTTKLDVTNTSIRVCTWHIQSSFGSQLQSFLRSRWNFHS